MTDKVMTDHQKALERVRRDREELVSSTNLNLHFTSVYRETFDLLELLIPIAGEHKPTCNNVLKYHWTPESKHGYACSCGQAERDEAIRKYGEGL